MCGNGHASFVRLLGGQGLSQCCQGWNHLGFCCGYDYLQCSTASHSSSIALCWFASGFSPPQAFPLLLLLGEDLSMLVALAEVDCCHLRLCTGQPGGMVARFHCVLVHCQSLVEDLRSRPFSVVLPHSQHQRASNGLDSRCFFPPPPGVKGFFPLFPSRRVPGLTYKKVRGEKSRRSLMLFPQWLLYFPPKLPP